MQLALRLTRIRSAHLFAAAVLIWGTTWHAIVYQLGHSTPEFGVTLRFALAGAAVLAYAAWRGDRLRLSAREHALLALQGSFMFSLSYLCIYHAERHVPSGLVAVAYSASPLLAGLGAWALWRTPITPRFIAGGLCGLAGVAVIFWPEIAGASQRPGAALGLAFAVGSVLLSAVGALSAMRNARLGLPFWVCLGWALLYGAALCALVLLASGQALSLPTAPSWWLSLAYLSLAGTVVAVAAFLTLQQRLGPGKAASVGVMTPVVALAVSTAFEGYRPGWMTLAGAALAVSGNLLMLRRDAPVVTADATAAG